MHLCGNRPFHFARPRERRRENSWWVLHPEVRRERVKGNSSWDVMGCAETLGGISVACRNRARSPCGFEGTNRARARYCDRLA